MNAVTTEFEQMYNATYDNVSFYVLTNNSKRTTENPVEANVLSATLSELISE